MKKIILKIDGMSCSACSNHIEKYLNKQKGVIDASVNLVMGQALIHYEDDIDIKTLGKYINESGYTYKGIYDEKKETKKDKNKKYLIILSLLIIVIMYISMSHMLNIPTIPLLNMMNHPINYATCLCLLSIPYLIYGKDIIIKGIKNIIHKSPNMDTLVTIGVLVSFTYSLVNMILIILGHHTLVKNLYFESVCMIILFIKIGRYIDKNSKEKTKEAIKELVKVTPESALLKTKQGEKEITIDEVKIGDILIVKPGMKVAVDGEITTGKAHFDESFITGESTPTKKEQGQKTVAGSINYDGIVEYKAEKIGPKSTISEMIHLVLEASNSKMPISKIADKVSFYFTPIIITISIITFITYLILGTPLNTSITSMVTVLLVACPCALGLATPLAIVISIGSSAQKGILIKTSETLELASHINTIVFDKTGTLTYGTLNISKIYNYSQYNEKELLNIVANIETNSTHPISQALSNYKTKELKITNYKELIGLGITAQINDKIYYIGNSKNIKNIKKEYKKDEETLSKKGNSIIYVVENNNIIGLIGVKDIIKEDSKRTIKKLKELGYDIIMLTGDNETTANIISQELGITKVISNVMPNEKTNYIKKIQAEGKKVMMVGDGINDAPSLTTADIGVSFKNSTDIATNSSNVIITNNKIEKIITFIKIGKKTLKNIKQNLFWAFIYNILMIPIAIGLFKKIGIEINPMIATCTMMLSSLCVVFNALRLKKI